MRLPALIALSTLAAACGSPATPFGRKADVSAKMQEIAGKADGLRTPQDLAFNPDAPDELWVVNRKTDSTTTIFDASSADRTMETIKDPAANHFMEQVSSIAFGAPGTFATCQDSRNTYDNQSPANDFMGPALWSSDLEIYGTSNPEAVAFLSDQFGMPVDLGSHLDMLHQSPNCMGIAWEIDNIYWVFDGMDGAIVRYDFQHDHGVGYDDHSDGIISRYASGEVERVKGYVSHVALDYDSGILYIADTGNGRIATLDTRSGRRGDSLFSVEPGVDHHEVKGVKTETLLDGLDKPAGLELIDGTLVVTESGTGRILMVSLEGEILSTLDTGLADGSLAGIHGQALDDLWFVDADANTLYRLQP